MKLTEISREVFEAELKEVQLNEVMLGAIGSGKIDTLALMRDSDPICQDMVKYFINRTLARHELTLRATKTSGPAEMAQLLICEPDYIDLPVKLFLLGLRLGQKPGVEAPDAVRK